MESIEPYVISLGPDPSRRQERFLQLQEANHRLALLEKLGLPLWLVAYTTVSQLEALNKTYQKAKSKGQLVSIIPTYQEDNSEGYRIVTDVKFDVRTKIASSAKKTDYKRMLTAVKRKLNTESAKQKWIKH